MGPAVQYKFFSGEFAHDNSGKIVKDLLLKSTAGYHACGEVCAAKVLPYFNSKKACAGQEVILSFSTMVAHKFTMLERVQDESRKALLLQRS